ncbi:uncharacterized protein LOC132185328 [Corylus avellana]|uniref:uncharacterized protein LOC132185328 n=1 Tax=Corylus avellana TaxID=13451 RepID=UPI00286B8FF8|nr:uncharacterized protein LOC132185328 [Corylus avellana]
MKMFVSHSDLRAMTLNATGLRHHQGLHPVRSDPRRQSGYYRIPHLLLPVRPRAVYGIALEEKTKKKKKNDKKPAICTADELHHVSVPNSDWTLALWRYLPSPQAQPRNHPLLLLSGVATNAIGYDLSPEYVNRIQAKMVFVDEYSKLKRRIRPFMFRFRDFWVVLLVLTPKYL